MAMSGDDMADAIISAMGGEDTPERRAAFNNMCGAIVAYLKANMELQGVLGAGLTNSGGPVAGTLIVAAPAVK